MTGFEILDLVIGMIFIYFLLSLICVSIQETYARFRRLRMFNLKKWLTDTFNEGETAPPIPNANDPGKLLRFAIGNWFTAKLPGKKNAGTSTKRNLGDRIWCNIIIDGLTQAKRGASYLSRTTFVHALLDEIHYGEATVAKRDQQYQTKPPYDFESLKDSIIESTLLPDSVRRMLLQLHHESFNNLETFKLKIGKWFDEAMERNSGTYKKSAQSSVLVFSFLIAIALNVDSIKLANYFYENKDEAARIADAAEAMVKDKDVIRRIDRLKNDSTAVKDTTLLAGIRSDIAEIRQHHEQLEELGLPIGWKLNNEASKDQVKTNRRETDRQLGYGDIVPLLSAFWKWLSNPSESLPTLIGWVITAIAVSLGAPFWFDILNKLVNLRSNGRKPEEIQPNEAKSTTVNTEKVLA